MFKRLFLLFLLIPLLELYLLLEIGGVIGAVPTVLLTIFTAILGAAFIRWQGLNALRSMQEKLRYGEPPAVEVVTGVSLLIAGALLLTPGFLTDTIGFLLLIPAVRQAIFGYWLLRNLQNVRGQTSVWVRVEPEAKARTKIIDLDP